MFLNRRLVVLALLATAPLCAQAIPFPTFECQGPVPFLLTAVPDCEGLVSTVNFSPNGDAYVSGTASCGFPTQGAQYLIVPGNNPSAFPSLPFGGPLPRPLPVGYSEVQVTIPAGAADVSITWDFFNGEGGAYTSWNDGMSIDIVDPGTQLSLLNIVYADTNSPLAPSACSASWMSPNATNVNSGTDAILDGPQQTCVLLPALPPGAYLSIVAWTGGDDVISSACFVDDIQWNTGCPPVSTPNMPNSLEASLNFTGTSCLPTGTYPFQRLIAAGAQTQMTIATTANGQQPYALFATPGSGVVAGPGIPTPYGVVDFDPLGLANLAVVIDGIGGLTFLDAVLGNTGPSGSLTLPFTLPGSGAGTWASFQAICVDPANPFGFTLSAATQINFDNSAPTLAFAGATPTGNAQDTTTQVVFPAGLMVPFYGALYSDAWVNSNGSVTFGAGDINWISTGANLLIGQARISVLWDELGVGPNDYTATSSSFTVSWTNYPEYGGVGASDFAMSIDVLGNITLAYGAVTATGTVGQDPLVGISPGFNSPVGLATGAAIDLSAQAIGLGYVGTPTESIFEVFGTNLDIVAPCGAGQITFAPNPGGTIPGDQGYTAF